MKRSAMPARVVPLRRNQGLADVVPLVRAPAPARVVPLRPRSRKMAKVYREQRVPLVRALFAEPSICEVPSCTRTATDLHEPKFRSRLGSSTDRANVRLLCRVHHMWVHDHPQGAHELGLAVNSWE